MMTLEQLRQHCAAENAACRRLEAAGYKLEGWDACTNQRIVGWIVNQNTNREKYTFFNFPSWQAASAALLD
jgi:hypothetical protein